MTMTVDYDYDHFTQSAKMANPMLWSLVMVRNGKKKTKLMILWILNY